MASLKLVLDQRRKRKNETCPLVIRLSHKGKTRDLTTHVFLKEKEFDKENCKILYDQELQDEVSQLLISYRSQLRKLLNQNVSLDINEIKTRLLNLSRPEFTIKQFWNKEILYMQSVEREGGAHVYGMVLSALSNVIELDVPFTSLGRPQLNEIEMMLYRNGVSTNGIAVYMRTLRAVCNKAINQGIVDHNWYPFRGYKIRKTKTTPRNITLEEMQKYFQLNLPTDHMYYRSWIIGKLIFMLRGINLKDLLLLKPENVIGDRIIYNRAKTGRQYSVAMLGEAKELLPLVINEQYISVPMYEQRRKVVNAHLKGLGKMIGASHDLTTYVFRYTYANIARQMGYSKELIAEALGHQYGSAVTGIYLQPFDQELVDDMNGKLYKVVKKKGS